jgi:hypothetical protein
VVNFVTGIPITPTAAFSSAGTLTESAANGTLGLANLYIPLNFKNAYVSSWNLAVQQALPANMTLQLAYVANHGTHIDIAQNINLPSVYGQSGTSDPYYVAFGKTAAVTQYFIGDSSNYESLQAQLSRRFTHGLAFVTAFTWGKAQGYQTGGQDGALLFFSGPIRRNYNLLDFDRKRNFEQTVTYELPAGHGHRLFSTGIASYVLGGWRTSAIISAVSGLPFTITTASPTTGTAQTVNLVGQFQVTHNVAGGSNAAVPWFNPGTAAAPVFAVPASGVLGTTQRNQFRGPAYFSDNLSIFKSFPVYHESSLEARFDAFNLTNTPAFGLPATGFSVLASGAPASTFGLITSTLGSGVGNVNGVGGPRVLQAGLKYTF